ncbi:inner membrane protein YrbG [Klebsiella pneumoniae]|nr:inner membrane protein YrbG [Klebsiella pneumoniae]
MHSDILRRELPLMFAGQPCWRDWCSTMDQLTRLDGLFLLALALLWLLFTIKIARLAERQGSDSLTREQLAELPREGSLPVALLWLGVAMIVMPMATRMVVDNSTVLANYFAISELTVGLTVVAIGTSLPELATAIAGARKGEDDIAIGNIIGANILNIALVLGLPALIAPGSFATEAFHSRLWRDAAGQPDLRSAVLAPSAAAGTTGWRAAGRRLCGLVGDAVLDSTALR